MPHTVSTEKAINTVSLINLYWHIALLTTGNTYTLRYTANTEKVLQYLQFQDGRKRPQVKFVSLPQEHKRT